ncbi:HAUS augmin-like complex subunit 3 [Musa troglodytarum]|uniref:HAUS augmin-like complex subunit 3 n=1 Tax=Musa troglodytarum TaxID=320322 RepID=A0A9E7K564_9LILI|nr:HAUS augmin-like complex subunit 3 [Musa troglodytarum]
MSGGRLCAVLGELGFDAQDALDPDSFEWPFQYEEARPLLDWICSSLRPSNVLSPSELSQYEQFLHEGRLLEGEDLDSAFDSISAFSSKKDNQEAVFGAEERLIDIREAKLAYKAEVLELQKQLERQQSLFDMLAGQASALIQGRRARVSATSAVNAQLITLDERLSARNLEMNSVLGKIASTAQELAHYHSGDEDGIYLAYSDFHPYLIEDLACTKELNQWFSKQFDRGPLRLVAEEGKSKCSWVSLDDLTNCLIRGDIGKHNHHHNRVAELQRLRSIFATSERQWVEAQVENAKQQAILSMLKAQISSDEAHIHRDIYSLRKKHSELAGELSTLSHKEQKFLSETIPRLCSDLAQLQDTYILQGDYDLKVMRQEYYINRQKLYINHLVNQLARHQFLKIACQLERKTILGAYSLLKVIESELEGYLSAGNGRVGHCLSLIQAASEVHEQGAVDDRDTFLHSVRDLLSIHSNSQSALPTYVSAHGIVQQISGLQSDLLSLQFELENSLPEDRRRCINELCTLIQTLELLLFSSSTTAEPLLTPRPLMQALDDMEKVNSQVSAFVEEVTEAHRQKAEIVKHHPHEVGRERQIVSGIKSESSVLVSRLSKSEKSTHGIYNFNISCVGTMSKQSRRLS